MSETLKRCRKGRTHDDALALVEYLMARGDKVGYRLCARASVELERDGTVSPATMAEAAVWLTAMEGPS